MTVKSDEIERLLPAAVKKGESTSIIETLRDAEAADLAELVHDRALDLPTLENAGTGLIAFYTKMEDTRTEVLRALAKVVVLIRSKHRDDEGNPDWRGKTWDYRQAVGEMYARAGIPPSSQSNIQSALRYHVGNLMREVAPPEELEAAGLLTSSPKDRMNEQRNEIVHLWRTLTPDEDSEVARVREKVVKRGEARQQHEPTVPSPKKTSASMLAIAKTANTVTRRAADKQLGDIPATTALEIQKNLREAVLNASKALYNLGQAVDDAALVSEAVQLMYEAYGIPENRSRRGHKVGERERLSDTTTEFARELLRAAERNRQPDDVRDVSDEEVAAAVEGTLMGAATRVYSTQNRDRYLRDLDKAVNASDEDVEAAATTGREAADILGIIRLAMDPDDEEADDTEQLGMFEDATS